MSGSFIILFHPWEISTPLWSNASSFVTFSPQIFRAPVGCKESGHQSQITNCSGGTNSRYNSKFRAPICGLSKNCTVVGFYRGQSAGAICITPTQEDKKLVFCSACMGFFFHFCNKVPCGSEKSVSCFAVATHHYVPSWRCWGLKKEPQNCRGSRLPK